jgi:hypothetical protein
MSANVIREAFEYGDHEPSTTFRDALRVRFLDDVAHPTVDVRETGVPNEEETIVIDTDEITRPHSRRSVWFGIAATIVLIAGLGLILVNHRSDSTSVDTSHDPTIAREALVKVADLGSGWEVVNGGLTSHAVADIAAKVPECAPYMDAAFDGPGRRSTTTSGRVFGSLATTLAEWVYLFPSEEAASAAMDKIAEPGFIGCFTKFWEVLIPAYSPGTTVTATPVASPAILRHGDRQVVVTLQPTYTVGSVTTSPTVVSVFVQVGRGIAYIDPVTDQRDPTDPAGSIEQALSLATNALDKALAAGPKG